MLTVFGCVRVAVVVFGFSLCWFACRCLTGLDFAPSRLHSPHRHRLPLFHPHRQSHIYIRPKEYTPVRRSDKECVCVVLCWAVVRCSALQFADSPSMISTRSIRHTEIGTRTHAHTPSIHTHITWPKCFFFFDGRCNSSIRFRS